MFCELSTTFLEVFIPECATGIKFRIKKIAIKVIIVAPNIILVRELILKRAAALCTEMSPNLIVAF